MNKLSRMKVACGRIATIAFAIQLACLVTILTFSSPLKAQSFYGSLVGTVTDATGAVVPDATVTVTNVGTNTKQVTKSDGSGRYEIVNLVPATYKVDVDKSGFKHFLRDQVAVQVGAAARLDVQLAVGAATETVEVSTALPLLQSDSSSLTQVITGEQVQDTPLNGRNVENLIALAPGVVPGGAAAGTTALNQGTRTAGGVGWGNYQIGGAIQGQSAQFVDGVPNNLLGGNNIALVISQDALQEFSVSSSNTNADFGRYAGGVVNMTSKSGGNTFHGTAYEYLRNRDFNANDYFSNLNQIKRPQYNLNQFGAFITGPIKKDKLFFMAGYEALRSFTGNPGSTTIPTSAASRAKYGTSDEQDGIFPGSIFGVTSSQTSAYTDGPTGCNVDGPATAGNPDPGYYTITNLYTGNCGDSTNKVIKQFYPDPNLPGETNNWSYTGPLDNTQWQVNGRIDYVISPKQRLFGRYTYWAVQDTGHTEFGGKGLNGTTWPTLDGHNAVFTHQFVLGDTYTLNPTTVLDVRLDYVRQYDPNLAANMKVNEAQFGSSLGTLASQEADGSGVTVQPAFQASGPHNFYNMGNYPNWGYNWGNTYGINASLSKVAGPHTLKFGADIRLMDASSFGVNGGSSGSFKYANNSGLTNGYNYPGDEWAAFLLGLPSSVSFPSSAKVGAYSYYQGYYLTDNWQATRNLTINLGLRYELPGAVAERNNKATVLLPTYVDPNTGITGTEVLVASSAYAGRTTVTPVYNLFAPHVGLAYRINDNTVFSGGWGIAYLPADIVGGVMPGGSPINAATTTANLIATPTLQGSLAALVTSGLIQPSGRTNPNFMTKYGSRTSFLNQGISGPVPTQTYPRVQQWNLSLSHQFKGDTMLGVSYSGLSGLHLPGGNKALDQIPDQYLSLATTTATTGTLAGTANSGLATVQPCAAANNLMVSVAQCDRPFPFYNGVTDSVGWYARENYYAIQVKGEKRFGRAGVLSGNFTHSQNMANTDTQNGFLESKPAQQGGSTNGGIQDWNNLAGEYSLLSFDVTNRAVFSYQLKLPMGKGQKFVNNMGSLDPLVSGWAISGITTIQSGFPVDLNDGGSGSLFASQNGYGISTGNLRPNAVGGCNKKVSGSGLTRVTSGAHSTGLWFNPACFAFPGLASFGSEPRVDSTLRGDGQKNFDFSLDKSTTIYEKASIEFKAEFYNIFNRVQFAPPGNSTPASLSCPVWTPSAYLYNGNVVSNGSGGTIAQNCPSSNSFGQVTYQVNPPRQVQLSLRINY